VCDEKCVNEAVGEDQTTCLEVSSAMSGETLELPIKITIGLLAMPRNPYIDSTSFPAWMLKNLSLKQTKKSVYFQ